MLQLSLWQEGSLFTCFHCNLCLQRWNSIVCISVSLLQHIQTCIFVCDPAIVPREWERLSQGCTDHGREPHATRISHCQKCNTDFKSIYCGNVVENVHVKVKYQLELIDLQIDDNLRFNFNNGHLPNIYQCLRKENDRFSVNNALKCTWLFG